MDQQIEREGLVNIIKYDEDNAALVWKHPVEDFRMGAQLIVHESQEAVFRHESVAGIGAGKSGGI